MIDVDKILDDMLNDFHEQKLDEVVDACLRIGGFCLGMVRCAKGDEFSKIFFECSVEDHLSERLIN